MKVTRSLAALAPFLVLALAAAPALAGELRAKRLAAAPEDVLSGLLRLPDPAECGQRSRSALLAVEPAAAPGGGGLWQRDLPLAGDGEVSLTLIGPRPERLRLRLGRPGLAPETPERLEAAGLARTRIVGLDPLQPGGFAEQVGLSPRAPETWRVRVSDADAPTRPGEPRAYLLLASSGPLRLYSHLDRHDRVVGRDVGVVAWAYDARRSPQAGPPLPVGATLVASELRVQGPNGLALRLPMVDDGQHGDRAAGDGVLGARVPTPTPGSYRVQVVSRGVGPAGETFLRTVQHEYRAVSQEVALTGAARTRVLAPARLAVDLEAWASERAGQLMAGAEVWGRDAAGVPRLACWIGGLVEPGTVAAGPAHLTLELDVRWLDRADLRPPLELREVRLQDPRSWTVVDELEVIEVEPGELPARLGSAPQPIDDTMRMGAAAQTSALRAPAGTVGVRAPAPDEIDERALMLVHGYCSDGAPWPAGDFSGLVSVFMDPDANRTHDEFAQLIAAFGEQHDSFAVVAHSQGGSAALHLYAFYFSGLDRAPPGRLIQSLATPYQGTPLAGNLAILGQIFGGGCGSNDDLSPSGAALWLANVPTWARARVHYWTTSSAQGASACNFLSGLFLDDPEDGVVEQVLSQLPGAVNMGHEEGWCHTSGMTAPPSPTDSVRNVEMDAQAAR